MRTTDEVTEIRRLREEAGMTQEEAAEATGTKLRTFQAWDRGDREPGYQAMDHIRAVLRKEAGMHEGGADLAQSLSVSKDEEYVRIEQVSVEASAGDGRAVHIEEVSGGELMPHSVVRREFGVRADRIKRIRIWGDSMEPTLSSGDIVYAVMMEDEAPSDGVVYIMRSPAGLVCKRLRIDVEDGTSGEPSYFVRVVSDNPSHQDLRLTLSTFQSDWRLVAYVPKATRSV